MAAKKQSSAASQIRKLDKEWGDAASGHDLDAVVAFYARDGSVVWPGEKAHHGTAAIRKAWARMFRTMPELYLRFTAERIVVSKGGDLASDFGKVTMRESKKSKTVIAKYVVVWRKENGAWKVLYDCYNLNTDG